MAWNAWKYYCSKLLPSNELTYQMNVTENESILSWWEWWTSCGATEVWRTPALWRIYFIRWRFLHNITWLNSHRTGQDLKKKKFMHWFFLSVKGLSSLYEKQNNTWLLVDMKFLFSCSNRHLTHSLRSLVSYVVKHSKRNSISTRAHALFSM